MIGIVSMMVISVTIESLIQQYYDTLQTDILTQSAHAHHDALKDLVPERCESQPIINGYPLSNQDIAIEIWYCTDTQTYWSEYQ